MSLVVPSSPPGAGRSLGSVLIIIGGPRCGTPLRAPPGLPCPREVGHVLVERVDHARVVRVHHVDRVAYGDDGPSERRELLEFVGVEYDGRTEFKRKNANRELELRETLRAAFAPDVERLGALLGRDPSHWR